MQATDYDWLELGEAIPQIIQEAMSADEFDIVRGLQASAHWEWHWIRGAEALVGLIMVNFPKNDLIYLGEAEDVMRSVRWREFLDDFDFWGLLEYDPSAQAFRIPARWRDFVNTLDPTNPDLGPKLLGRLLGACSLARRVPDPDADLNCFPYRRRAAMQQAFRQYIPVRSLVANADPTSGSITQDNGRRAFTRQAGYDAEPRWISLRSEDRQRPVSLRFFEDAYADPLYVRQEVLRAFERVRQRTLQIYRDLGL